MRFQNSTVRTCCTCCLVAADDARCAQGPCGHAVGGHMFARVPRSAHHPGKRRLVHRMPARPHRMLRQVGRNEERAAAAAINLGAAAENQRASTAHQVP